MPPAANDDSKTDNGNAQNNGSDEKNADDSKDDASSGKNQDGGADASAAKPEATKSQELSPEIRQKLRKLEKLEATYPGKAISTNARARAGN